MISSKNYNKIYASGEGCTLRTKLFFSLYSLYFILTPFYFWRSGYPQVADYVLLLLIFCYMVFEKRPMLLGNKYFVLVCIAFAAYIITVNFVWTILLQNADRFLMVSLYYVFNCVVAIFIVILHSRYRDVLLDATYNSALISISLQFIMFIIAGGFSGGRMTGSFNNPNQLGYYSLLTAAILVYTSSRIENKSRGVLVGLFMGLVLVLSSLSKAAIIAYVGLLGFFLIFQRKSKRMKLYIAIIIILMIVVIPIVYNTTSFIQESELVNSVERRLLSIGTDSDDSLQARGYYRIVEYPQYWFFGAGEGEYQRFSGIPVELHSTLGNIQVSYGVIGSLLFFSLILISLGKNKFQSWYLILFILLYGVAHNGIRSSLFWILLALISVDNAGKYKNTRKV